MEPKNIVLNVNGIEVIYNHVILVLKGVSADVARKRIAGEIKARTGRAAPDVVT